MHHHFPILRLPTELRLQIFKYYYTLYTDTVRHHAKQVLHTGSHSTAPAKTPAPYTAVTSPLLVCRKFHAEAGPILASNPPSISFSCPRELLTTFSHLPNPKLQIPAFKHLSIKAFPFPFCDEIPDSSYTTYSFNDSLSVFPGLKLDKLTAYDCFHDPGSNDGWGDIGTYSDIEGLIHSTGWRELRFITSTTEFMTNDMDAYRSRIAQPEGWDAMLKEKDGGAESGAGVWMFVSGEYRLGQQLNEATCRIDKMFDVEFVEVENSNGSIEWKKRDGLEETKGIREWKCIPGHLENAEEWPKPPELPAESEREVSWRKGDENSFDANKSPDTIVTERIEHCHREVMVIARRGKNKNYQDDGTLLAPKLRKLFDEHTWEELQETGWYLEAEIDPCRHL